MSTRKALLIGIDHYRDTPLNGCVSDCMSLYPLLDRHEEGERNFDTKLITSTPNSTISADAIDSQLVELLREREDIALFHFSGHGHRENQRSYLVAQDGSKIRLTDILERINQSQPRQIVVFLDCCFSGGLGATTFLGEDYSILREGVALLVASRAGQPSAETPEGGVFSTLVVGGLEGGAADIVGYVTIAGLYAYMDEALGAWDQRPLLKANLTHLTALRKCRPLVPLETLRRLAEFFPSPEHQYPLDPSYEPDKNYPPHNPVHEEIFKQLQDCNRARLVDPVGADHMFYAAINSQACELTPLGQRYWRMARDNRI